MTQAQQLHRYLDEQAGSLTIRRDLADDVRHRATSRRRQRWTIAAALVAAVMALTAALGPTLLRTTRADVISPRPDGRAVIPRTIPPLGRNLPTLFERNVHQVTVAWTRPSAQPRGGGLQLLGLDASDGRAVVLASGQVARGSPVSVSPDGTAVAYIARSCPGRAQSLAWVLLSQPHPNYIGANCDLPMTTASSSGPLALPAFAWSADSRSLAAVVRESGHLRVAVRAFDGAGYSWTDLPGDATGVAAAPSGWAVKRPDGSWDLVRSDGSHVTHLHTGFDGQPSQVLAWSTDGGTWAQARWGSGAIWGYRLATYPAEHGVTTGGFRQALTSVDRWLVPSGDGRFLAVAGPFGNVIGRNAANLGVPADTTLERVVQSVTIGVGHGPPVSQVAFTGDTPGQDVQSIGVAGELLVDPVWVATVPDDGHRSWVQVAGWAALGLLAVAAVGWLVVRRRRTTLS